MASHVLHRFILFSILVSTTVGSKISTFGSPGYVHSLKELRGGAETAVTDYAGLCEAVKGKILGASLAKVQEMQKTIELGECVSNFGTKCDDLCNQAVEEFASAAPDADTESSATATVYDKVLEQLEAALDAPLQVLYLRQLALIRSQVLATFKSSTAGSADDASSEYAAMLQADARFVELAEEATREGSDWDYASERSHLQSVMNEWAGSQKKLVDLRLKTAQQQSVALTYLQQQQQMIQQLQMQLYGQSSPWNVGVAYRIPDTNFNLNGSYQQGRANLQLSCVPDEYAPMLGPNGFTSGVGPGNLGLSLNLSI